MQLQRIQTLYFLIAAILTAIYCFIPYATISVSDNSADYLVSETPVLLILNITITVLLVITIFMYRNIKQQIKVALVDILLILGSIAASLVYTYVGHEAAQPAWIGISLQCLAFGFAISGRRAMKRDQALLASADRLR